MCPNHKRHGPHPIKGCTLSLSIRKSTYWRIITCDRSRCEKDAIAKARRGDAVVIGPAPCSSPIRGVIGIAQLGNVPRTCNRISIGHTLSVHVHTRVVVLAGVNLQGAVSGVLSESSMLQPSYQPHRVIPDRPGVDILGGANDSESVQCSPIRET